MRIDENRPTLKLIINDLLANSHAGTIQAKSIKFDPNHLDAEREAVQSLFSGWANQNSNNFVGKLDEQPSDRLSEIIRAYCDERRAGNNWTGKSASEFQRIFDELIEIVGDISAGSFTKRIAKSYKDTLCRLPPNYSKKPQYADLKTNEIIALKPAETLTAKTVNKRLQTVSALFNWAQKNSYCTDNPLEGMSVKITTRAADRRDPYSDAELYLIFGSRGFVKPNGEQPNQYWLPILALFTGARLEELAQLLVNDITQKDDIWYLDINLRGKKRLKSSSSERRIPLHDSVIEFGFLKFLQEQEKKGCERLFPELSEQRDGFGQSFQKWFGRQKDKKGFPKFKKSFHSLRHTVTDRLRNAGVEQSKISAILGHKIDSVTNIYGQGYDLRQLKEAVNRLEYDQSLLQEIALQGGNKSNGV